MRPFNSCLLEDFLMGNRVGFLGHPFKRDTETPALLVRMCDLYYPDNE